MNGVDFFFRNAHKKGPKLDGSLNGSSHQNLVSSHSCLPALTGLSFIYHILYSVVCKYGGRIGSSKHVEVNKGHEMLKTALLVNSHVSPSSKNTMFSAQLGQLQVPLSNNTAESQHFSILKRLLV